MLKRIKTYLEKTTTRHYLRVVAFVVFGISAGALITLQVYPYIQNYILVMNAEPAPIVEEVTTTTPYTLPRSKPVTLRIPKINLETTFEVPLGLNADKTVEVPDSYEKVGWYKYGAAPGEVGPAVILGHVDSYEGPAVFFSLGQLTAGDRVYVTRADGTEAVFEVVYFERYALEDFPTEKVYGKTAGSELRLITCTGTYNRGEQRYTHNLVVYAKLVPEESTSATTTPE